MLRILSYGLRRMRGWRGADSGPQTIRLIFDRPQRLNRISLAFEETETERGISVPLTQYARSRSIGLNSRVSRFLNWSLCPAVRASLRSLRVSRLVVVRWLLRILAEHGSASSNFQPNPYAGDFFPPSSETYQGRARSASRRASWRPRPACLEAGQIQTILLSRAEWCRGKVVQQ